MGCICLLKYTIVKNRLTHKQYRNKELTFLIILFYLEISPLFLAEVKTRNQFIENVRQNSLRFESMALTFTKRVYMYRFMA